MPINVLDAISQEMHNPSPDNGFDLIDYAEAADAIRDALNRPDFSAVLSNRVNIILSALDKACSAA